MGPAGRTILITRAPEDAAAWGERVEARGGRAVVRPCIAVERVPAGEARASLAAALAGADWVAFTSKRAAAATAAVLEGRLPAGVRIAAVGAATGHAVAERLGREPELIGRQGAKALAHELLTQQPPPAAVAFPAAEAARPDLEAALGEAGVAVRRVTLYRTVAPREPLDLAALGVDVVLVASPSAAEGLAARAEVPPHVAVVSIGPTTSAAARAAGLTVAAEASEPTLDALLDAIP